MVHADGAVGEYKKKKKSKQEKGEYMRRISSSSRLALNVKISVHEAERAEGRLTTTQDDGHSLEVKKEEKKDKETEELVLQAEDYSSKRLIYLARARALEYTSHNCRDP